MHGLADILIKFRWPLLVIALLLAVLSVRPALQLRYDRSIERMFAANDPVLPSFRKLQRTLGGGELLLVTYHDPQLMSEQGFARLRKVESRIEQVPGVALVVSLPSLPGANVLDGSKVGQQLRKVFVGYTHNEAADAAGLLCLLARDQDAVTRRPKTIATIQEITGSLPQGFVIGEPVLVEEGLGLLQSDGRRLMTWSTVLLLSVVAISFRSVRWVIIPLVVVQLAVLLTRSTVVLSGAHLTMVSSMLAAIITVVGVATVVHIAVRYRNARQTGLDPTEALREAIRLLAAPIFFAIATDAAGFAALTVSSVGPVREFGLMMAIGSLFVLVSVAMVVPGLALLGAQPGASSVGRTGERLEQRLTLLLMWVFTRPKLVGGVTLAVALVSLIGWSRTEVETDFTRNFRDDTQLVQAYRHVEENFGGAGVWDVMVPAPGQLRRNYLSRVLKFEERLRREVPQLTSVLSLADILDAAAGGIMRRRIGADVAIVGSMALLRRQLPELVEANWNSDPENEGEYWLRVMLRANQRAPAEEKKEAIRRVRELAGQAFSAREGRPVPHVTGYYVLLSRLVSSIVRDQWTTFAVATAAIALMMLVAFRSVVLALVALIPNALAVAVVFGAMGWWGQPINMGAAMIAAVSMGLSVDSSIHYVMNYQRARREGDSLMRALTAAQKTVGRAAILSTLALVVGFSTLCQSDFGPTVHFGLMVGVSMFAGLIGNIVLLPYSIRAAGSWFNV